MTPFKHIQRVEGIVNEMKRELKYSKNIERDAKRINTIIDLVHSFEEMLTSKYKTDEIDNLLCYILNDFMLKQETTPKMEIQLPYFIDKIHQHLKYDSYNNTNWLAERIINFEFMRKYAVEDLAGCKRMADGTTREGVAKLLKNLFKEIKQNIVWRK